MAPTKNTTAKGATARSTAKKRVTSYDVAREAGVSQSAVSRAFRPGLSVSKKTRDKVTKAAKKLGYKPNAIARMLITQRSGMVAVIVSSLANFIYPELLSRLSDALHDKRMQVLLFTLDDAEDIDSILDQIWAFQVDGVIALTAHFDHERIQQFEEHHIPVVLYNRRVPDLPVNTVSCDHDQGIGQLVRSLVATGHERFLVLSGPEMSDVAIERREIALRHLAALGFDDVPVVSGDFTYESGMRGMADFLGTHEPPDAVICGNDTMAMGCIDELQRNRGIAVPETVSVVGFDGIHSSAWAAYGVTTIRQPVSQMARAAVDILADRIENPDLPPEKRVLAGQLREGRSARI